MEQAVKHNKKDCAIRIQLFVLKGTSEVISSSGFFLDQGILSQNEILHRSPIHETGKPGTALMGVWGGGCPAGEGRCEGACSGRGLHVAQINFILKLFTFVAPVKNLHLKATSKYQLAELM